MIALRPYQLAGINALRRKMAAGTKRLCLCSPTGSGKTVIFSEVIRRAVERKRRAVVLVHRKELVDQTLEKLARLGVAAGVIASGDKRRDDSLPAVQVCSIQTLARRLDKGMPPADLVVIDECHHAPSDSYRKVLAAWPEAYLIGATATPWRSDKVGLRGLFEDLVLVATYAELQAMGALVEADYFGYDAPDLHAVPVVAGEYNQKSLGLVVNTGVLVGNVVREYLKHASGRRGLVFPVNVEHSQALVEEFKAAGVAAEHLDCDTPRRERERIINALRGGDVTLVSSVGVLTEGFDAPAAEVCILARPTMSLSLHLQMLGRVCRPSLETGKVRALVHCHSGNIFRHGFLEDERDYTLTTTPKRTTDLHTCPICCSIFGSIRDDGTCPKCLELIAPPREIREAQARREKEQLEGERLAAEELKRRRMEQLGAWSEEKKQAKYRELQQIAAVRGYKPNWAAVQYHIRFGSWPQRGAA